MKPSCYDNQMSYVFCISHRWQRILEKKKYNNAMSVFGERSKALLERGAQLSPACIWAADSCWESLVHSSPGQRNAVWVLWKVQGLAQGGEGSVSRGLQDGSVALWPVIPRFCPAVGSSGCISAGGAPGGHGLWFATGGSKHKKQIPWPGETRAPSNSWGNPG